MDTSANTDQAASTSRTAARLHTVEEHIRHENEHDLEGILSTFGTGARYEEQPWGERYEGLAGVRSYYEDLLASAPDLSIDVRNRHIAGDAIILEVIIRGTHLGTWRGLPPTGRHFEFPLCAIYTFTEDDKLAGERIYYDRATLLRQLGVYREPMTRAGRITTALNHPITLARAFGRKLIGRSPDR